MSRGRPLPPGFNNVILEKDPDTGMLRLDDHTLVDPKGLKMGLTDEAEVTTKGRWGSCWGCQKDFGPPGSEGILHLCETCGVELEPVSRKEMEGCLATAERAKSNLAVLKSKVDTLKNRIKIYEEKLRMHGIPYIDEEGGPGPTVTLGSPPEGTELPQAVELPPPEVNLKEAQPTATEVKVASEVANQMMDGLREAGVPLTQWRATVDFEGFPVGGEGVADRVADRVKRAVETHPTLGFSTQWVGAEKRPPTDEPEHSPDCGIKYRGCAPDCDYNAVSGEKGSR